MVDGPSTFAGTGDAKVVKTIALESSKMKAKKANALDTQARRIRSPNGKLTQGTIRCRCHSLREPKTTIFQLSFCVYRGGRKRGKRRWPKQQVLEARREGGF